MVRAFSLLAVAVLAVAALPQAPAGASGSTLVADAGDSAVAFDGGTLPLHGFAFGGEAPYNWSWSFGGDASRFSAPHAQATTFSTAGLAPGDHVVTLTVRDNLSATATDTVVVRADVSSVLLSATGTTLVGLPDETVGLDGADQATRDHPFVVPAGTPSVTAVLDWKFAGDDYDLVLLGPDGREATGNAGRTSAKPERVTVANPAAGTWTARVEPWLVLDNEYTVTVTAPPAVSLPKANANSPYEYGSADAQKLLGQISGGTAPTGAWDLDYDGIFETAGETVVASLPASAPGVHTVAFKATDANGYEHRSEATVKVFAEYEHVLRLGCGGDVRRPIFSFEFSRSGGTCWMHGGHHTYFLGEAVALRKVWGFVFAVELQQSPPVDPATPTTWPIRLETSADGATWTPLQPAEYKVAPLPFSFSGYNRQKIFFEFEADGREIRFLRVHNPPSAAQGLSGFLDNSALDLYADAADSGLDSVGPAASVLALSCAAGDVMEDFFAEHPCWFGGANRYDAASFFHTYHLGEGASVSRVAGTATVAPWRSDDWFVPLLPALEQVTGTRVTVQRSMDGIAWSDVGTFRAEHGVPTAFDLPLATPEGARFLRLVTEEHPRFDGPPPLHHPEAFFVDSALALAGTFAMP